MKIIQSFISNSSSSSFCIYGSRLSLDATKEILRRDHNIEIEEEYELEELLGLSVRSVPYDDDYFYIGRSFKTIKDDETGKDFKNSVEEKIKKFFPNQSLSTFEESYYDG